MNFYKNYNTVLDLEEEIRRLKENSGICKESIDAFEKKMQKP